MRIPMMSAGPTSSEWVSDFNQNARPTSSEYAPGIEQLLRRALRRALRTPALVGLGRGVQLRSRYGSRTPPLAVKQLSGEASAKRVVAVLEWAEKLIEKPTFRWAIGSTARQNSRERRCSSPSGGMSSGIRAVVAQPLAAAGDRRGSAMGAGRVKTCASQESVESFSLVPSSDSRRQHFLFSE
jgi:hypothetical protein